MTEILNIREVIITFYKNNETILFFIFKFLVGIFTFSLINNLGFAITTPNTIISIMSILILSLIFYFVSISIGYILIILFLAFNLLALQEIALLVFLFSAAVWALYIRILPKESILILACILAFKLNIEYIIPVLAGLYFSLTSIVAIALGVFIWSFRDIIINSQPNNAGILDIVDNITDTYSEIFTNVNSETEWLVISSIFIAQVIVVNLINNRSIIYAREIAVLSAMALNILGFITFGIIFNLNTSIFSIIFWTIISYIIVFIICFMDVVLDYKDVQNVKFEDEKNYYYVKIIPKIYSE